jgi:hypothetical protein
LSCASENRNNHPGVFILSQLIFGKPSVANQPYCSMRLSVPLPDVGKDIKDKTSTDIQGKIIHLLDPRIVVGRSCRLPTISKFTSMPV